MASVGGVPADAPWRGDHDELYTLVRSIAFPSPTPVASERGRPGGRQPRRASPAPGTPPHEPALEAFVRRTLLHERARLAAAMPCSVSSRTSPTASFAWREQFLASPRGRAVGARDREAPRRMSCGTQWPG